jgi:hypothetical protein
LELYKEELITLSRLLGYVDDVANQEGIFEVEIRVRLDDVDSWVVLGYGEAGEPCVLRIENKKDQINPWLPHPPMPGVRGPAQGGIISTKPGDGFTTINKDFS